MMIVRDAFFNGVYRAPVNLGIFPSVFLKNIFQTPSRDKPRNVAAKSNIA
jgi:hypothetical protein